MNDLDLLITVDLDGDPAVTAPEMQLIADLLPELIKDLLALQGNEEV